MTFKKFLGIEEFSTPEEVVDYLKSNDSTTDFTKKNMVLVGETNDVKLWAVASDRDVFVVRDDGFQLKTILRRKKSEFSFDIIREGNSPRLYIKNTVTTLPIVGSEKAMNESLKTLISH